MKSLIRIATLALVILTSFAAHAGIVRNGGTVIKKSGKYSLTRDITVRAIAGQVAKFGIYVNAPNVELDLAGFTIGPVEGEEGQGFGIFLGSEVRRIRIQNGHINRLYCGLQSVPNADIRLAVVERLQVDDCADYAIGLSTSGTLFIRSCVVTGIPAGAEGIELNIGSGAFAEVSDCSISGKNGAAKGISSDDTDGLFVRRCAVHNCAIGIAVTAGCKVMDNVTFGCTTAFGGNPVMLGVNN